MYSKEFSKVSKFFCGFTAICFSLLTFGCGSMIPASTKLPNSSEIKTGSATTPVPFNSQSETDQKQLQENSSWEVTVGRNFGRYHEFYEILTVKSNGEINCNIKTTEKKTITRNGKVGEEQISEIRQMLTNLDLPSAKKIPDGTYNDCIMSPHLPNVYFELKENEKKYGLTHCNEFGGESKKDKYTLIFTETQNQIYIDLRKKIISLFDEMREEIKE